MSRFFWFANVLFRLSCNSPITPFIFCLLGYDRPVLGRMKELLAYWSELPAWRRLWPTIKICRTVDELSSVVRTM